MAKTIRPGTTEPVLVDGRIRHGVVEAVTDQDTITVRVGSNSRVSGGTSVEVVATRQPSTDTRGTLFEA